MIFLMNDRVLDVDMAMLGPSMAAGRFRALSLAFVLQLGRELFSERPLLHRDDPARAARLAALIVCRSPRSNAALFEPARPGCAPDQVAARLAEVDAAVIAALHARQSACTLTPYVADCEVWRRMVA